MTAPNLSPRLEERQELFQKLCHSPFDLRLLQKYATILKTCDGFNAGLHLLESAKDQPGPARGRCSCCNQAPSLSPSPFCEACRDEIHYHCAYCGQLVSYVCVDVYEKIDLDLDKNLLLCANCEARSVEPTEDPLIKFCRDLLEGYLCARAYHDRKSQRHDRSVQPYVSLISAPFDALWLLHLLSDPRSDSARRHRVVEGLSPELRSTFELFLAADS